MGGRSIASQDFHGEAFLTLKGRPFIPHKMTLKPELGFQGVFKMVAFLLASRSRKESRPSEIEPLPSPANEPPRLAEGLEVSAREPQPAEVQPENPGGLATSYQLQGPPARPHNFRECLSPCWETQQPGDLPRYKEYSTTPSHNSLRGKVAHASVMTIWDQRKRIPVKLGDTSAWQLIGHRSKQGQKHGQLCLWVPLSEIKFFGVMVGKQCEDLNNDS